MSDLLAVSTAERRQRVAYAWEQEFARLAPEGAPVVLINGGFPISVPGTDLFHPFFPHPDFVHLTGQGAPRLVLAFHAGEWQLFGHRSTTDEMIWEQPVEPLGLPLAELAGWLAKCGITKASGPEVVWLGAPLGEPLAQLLSEGLGADTAARAALGVRPSAETELLASQLATVMEEDRLHKDEAALASLRQGALCSQRGFEWVFDNVTAGMTERQVQVAMEAEFFAAGAPRIAYDSIVAAGANSAFLHYVPSSTDPLRPDTATIAVGDLLLIDAGAQVGGYASDVTRTMVVGADPTETQAFLWRLVLSVQELAIDHSRPGTEWREVHLEAARMIGAGLVELGLLRGEPGELVSSGAVALFFPHGLGHLIGLAVHDAGGFAGWRERSSHPQLRYLRTDRPLEAGMVTSVEPGVYFIEALLGDAGVRQQFAGEVNWERVDEMRGFGGIRIEDDVLITAGEPEVLTAAIKKPLRIG